MDDLDTLAWNILAALDDLRVTDIVMLATIVGRSVTDTVVALDLLADLDLVQGDVLPTALGVLPQESVADHLITTSVAGDAMLRQRWTEID